MQSTTVTIVTILIPALLGILVILLLRMAISNKSRYQGLKRKLESPEYGRDE